MQIAIREIHGIMVKMHGCTSMYFFGFFFFFFFFAFFTKVDNFCDLLKLFQNGGQFL